MADYVYRRDVIDMIATKPGLTGDVRLELHSRVCAIKPADVIPRATIVTGIEEAIARLNAIRGQAINGDGQLDYTAYLELYDAITGILPEPPEREVEA